MKTLLVAETHAPTLELLRQLLAQAGYRVLTADGPEKALEQCAAERPDAVLLGTELPRVRGSSVGKLIRASDQGARLPMLAVDKGHLGKARGVGSVLDLMVNAYVPDPTKREELVAKIEQLLASAAQAAPKKTGMAATLARHPVVTGELQTCTLPAQLVGFYRLGRTGILVVAHGELSRRVFFKNGSPINFDSSSGDDNLPRWMVERGLMTQQTHDALMQRLADGRTGPDAALVAVGAVQPGEPLRALLRDWAIAKVAQTYGMRAGRFSFYAGEEFLSEVPTIDIPPLVPLHEATRTYWSARHFVVAMSKQLRLYPVRSAEFATQINSLGLSTADLKLALSIDGRSTLRELLASSRDLKHALSLCWYLSAVGVLELRPTPAEAPPGTAAPDAAARAGRAPARKRKPLPEAQAHELREEAIKIVTASYFRALNLDLTADNEAVERAYHEAATRFHPDSYAEFDCGPIEDLLVSVGERLSAAYRVLSDDEKRKAYVGFLLGRAEVSRAAPLNPQAEIELKRGEKHLRKGDLAAARAAFEKAVALNPREPEPYGFLAWTTFRAGPGSPEQRGRDAAKLVKKALSMNPALERLEVIGAIIEDAVGDPAEARRMLLRVLKRAPSCDLAKKALQGLSRRHGASAGN